MLYKKQLPTIVLAALLAACGSDENTVSSATGTPVSPQETAQCNEQSWFAGVTEICDGVLVYRDYVFDDYGADTGLLSPSPALLNLASRAGQLGNPLANTPGLLSPTAGDSRYPAGAESTADLVELRISKQGNTYTATFELNALYEAGQTIAAIAIDSDNNPATGSETLLGLSVAGADVVYEFNTGNPDTNLITGTFPAPANSTFKLWAVTAQSSGEVMNVAFRGPDEEAGAEGTIPAQLLPNKGNWWEDKQAAALGSGDITEFFAVVNSQKLNRGNTEKAVVGAGFKQRVYTSKYTVPNSTGEGMVLQGIPGREQTESRFCGQFFHFVGKYQPYGVYIPTNGNLDDQRSLQVILHGCEANHASQINQPNMQAQFGEQLDRVLISPLGRGPYGFYTGLSERDVLDVLDDALNTFNIDEDRVLVGGYSMGGYGSTRLAALYPDRFAGLSNWVGFTGSILNTPLLGDALIQGEDALAGALPFELPINSRIGGLGNISNYLNNLRHIPGTHSYAALDELVQVNTGLDWAFKLGQTDGVLYEFYMHLAAEHLTLIALDEWGKEAEFTRNLTVVKNPGRITYKTNEAFAFPQYEIKHDKAYWLSNIKGRAEGDIAMDVESFACTRSSVQFENGQTAGNGPVPFVQTFRRLIGMPVQTASENRFTAKLSNVASMNIDAAASCLSNGAAYTVESDGPVVLTFSNGKVLNLPAGSSTGNL
ncbi:hypothetical protein [Limnobacter parvus]|uniref:Peptidase S9 prolyl oligopeptidase catalytic domain-containing protein n=1 Tax=Limnobacter parvus TaxID=2939690 RepID=A0ABT1XM82_9BURK|nr:hypothetical protein [Limnobacter parvus]MCR2747648.1 hypothetical protein [Limnobacter parvus]